MEKKYIKVGIQLLVVAVVAFAVSAWVVAQNKPKPRQWGGSKCTKGSIWYPGPPPGVASGSTGAPPLQ